jgi:putative ABC transport system ATP-binding protein
MAKPVLDIRHVVFTWPGSRQPTLRVPAFNVKAGESVFLHGPSGSGKSTLLSLIAGVLMPGEGRISLCGRAWTDLGVAARDRHRVDHVGYIFQQFNLLPYLTVLDNVLLPCQFSRLRRDRAEARDITPRAQAQRWLQAMGLEPELWSRSAAQLSVGQQQRVAAARALMGEPELIVADEPTSALDEDRRDAFMDLLLNASASTGSAVVFVSHDLRLAPRCTRQVSIANLSVSKAVPA